MNDEITLLHNIRLMELVERLSERPPDSPPKGRLVRYAERLEAELLRGGWAGRRRLMLFLLRCVGYLFTRSRKLRKRLTLPKRRSDRDGSPLGQYARLQGGLASWRQASLAVSQRRLVDGAEAERMRQDCMTAWNRFAADRPDLPYLGTLHPHGGRRSPLRVLVSLGGGGLGDALLFSAMLKELRQKLDGCEIVLFFEKKVAEALYERSPDVACTVSGPWGTLNHLVLAARYAGIFDLVVDTYCFLPRFLICEWSRIDLDRHGAWFEGNRQLGNIIDRFSSNLGVALLDRACGMHVFDLLAATSGLPLHAGSPLVFSPDPAALDLVRSLNLPKLYVTVRDGANPGDTAHALKLGMSRTTKQLPEAKWPEICTIIRNAGLAIVQVGDRGDATIADTDIDLRGRSTLSQLAFIMKGAVAHVDTEGGLMHFARASNAPAIIFFGPTSDTFFGYPPNLNLSSPSCGHCWYSTEDWIARCPSSRCGAAAGTDIDLKPLGRRLAELTASKARKAFAVVDSSLAGEGPQPAGHAPSLRDWALAATRRWADIHSATAMGTSVKVIRDSIRMNDAPGLVDIEEVGLDGTRLARRPVTRGSIYNLPVNDDLCDVLLCDDVLAALPERSWAVREMMRLVRPGGLMVIATRIAIPGPLRTKTPAGRRDYLDVEDITACLDGAASGVLAWDAPRIERSAMAMAGIANRPGRSQTSVAVTWGVICLRRRAPIPEN